MQSQGSQSKRRLFLAVALVALSSAIVYWRLRDDHLAHATAGTVNRTDTGAAATAKTEPAAMAHRDVVTNVRPAPPAQSASPAPLPPPDTPLAQVYDELKARADRGDVAAASRLFHDIRRCFTARTKLAILPKAATSAMNDTTGLSAEELSAREKSLGALEESIRKAESDAAICANVTDEDLLVNPAAFRAAQLGDPVAGACYASGIMLLMGGLLDHPEWLGQYKDNALPFAQALIANGDWTMVEQLQRAYAQEAPFLPLSQVTGADASLSYRYLKLRRLGATEASSIAELDGELAAAAQRLSGNDVREGDAWAQDAYQRYFAATPRPADSHHDFCPDD